MKTITKPVSKKKKVATGGGMVGDIEGRAFIILEPYTTSNHDKKRVVHSNLLSLPTTLSESFIN
jgi:hypothetical protein